MENGLSSIKRDGRKCEPRRVKEKGKGGRRKQREGEKCEMRRKEGVGQGRERGRKGGKGGEKGMGRKGNGSEGKGEGMKEKKVVNDIRRERGLSRRVKE